MIIKNKRVYLVFCILLGLTSFKLNQSQNSKKLRKGFEKLVIQTIRENKIVAVFPEDQANPKVLEEIVRSTGVKMGTALIADGTAKEAHTFESMFSSNVRAIVSVLGTK